MGKSSVNAVSELLKYYHPIHFYLVMCICALGIIANLLTVVVLSRRHMRSSPTNIILCGLAAAQVLLLCNYVIYSVYTQVTTQQPCQLGLRTYAWLLYLLVNVNLNVIFHTTALVHTSLLAVFRYLTIHFPTRNLVTKSLAHKSVLATYLMVPVFCITFFFNSQIKPMPTEELNDICNDTSPISVLSNTVTYKLAYTDNELLFKYNWWTFGMVCKLFPCLCLSILSTLLIVDMRKAHKRQQLLKNASNRARTSHSQHMKTSIMLLLIVFLFIVVELPQAIFALVNNFNETFRRHIYYDLLELYEMLTVLYSSINFVLYCIMSSQFRLTFARLFLSCFPWYTPSHSAINEDTRLRITKPRHEKETQALLMTACVGGQPLSSAVQLSQQHDNDHTPL